jgi:hypothetical protein
MFVKSNVMLSAVEANVMLSAVEAPKLFPPIKSLGSCIFVFISKIIDIIREKIL